MALRFEARFCRAVSRAAIDEDLMAVGAPVTHAFAHPFRYETAYGVVEIAIVKAARQWAARNAVPQLIGDEMLSQGVPIGFGDVIWGSPDQETPRRTIGFALRVS